MATSFCILTMIIQFYTPLAYCIKRQTLLLVLRRSSTSEDVYHPFMLAFFWLSCLLWKLRNFEGWPPIFGLKMGITEKISTFFEIVLHKCHYAPSALSPFSAVNIRGYFCAFSWLNKIRAISVICGCNIFCADSCLFVAIFELWQRRAEPVAE